jgi:hypothetical protein
MALCELGPKKLGLYVLYQLGLRTGFFRYRTRDASRWTDVLPSSLVFRSVFHLPDGDALGMALGESGQEGLLAEADEIVGGQVRLFGGAPVPLRLTVPGPLVHWTELEGDKKGVEKPEAERADVKFVWEPGRFGWAYTLGRAYHLSGDERYAAAFWCFAETFLEANPPYLGPHWVSAQEVALRLMAFVFALGSFARSLHTTPEREARLAGAIAVHAARIPPTLVYARAQNNNHLLAEAAGLYTAGLVLPSHLSARRWRSLGWRWFHRGLRSQIARDGAYVQHSANYHRLMLQTALWVHSLNQYVIQEGESSGEDQGGFPKTSLERLVAGTYWLLALLDPESGRVPNLGPNDGAYIMPLTVCPFHDYRPVLQAAAGAFLGERPFAGGPWDEMNLWMGSGEDRWGDQPAGDVTTRDPQSPLPSHAPHVIRSTQHTSWAYCRVARFRDRPGHADQLHVDLWWRGLNVAQDAGTYLYNAPPPWDNALAHSEVHNTITVNGRDQMSRAGRFLYLDWAQGRIVAHERAGDGAWERLVAQHDGYRRLGVIHQRGVTAAGGGRWIVEDTLIPSRARFTVRSSLVTACLHWLLPDCSYELEIVDSRFVIWLKTPYGQVELGLSVGQSPDSPGPAPRFQMVRAGELVTGAGQVSPTWGWSSPTYGARVPTLSLRLAVEGSPPLTFKSEWSFPVENQAGG